MNTDFESEVHCFVCGKSVDGAHIVWSGFVKTDSTEYADTVLHEYADIVLHPLCADWMASALKRDVLEAFVGNETAEVWYKLFHRPVPV